MAPYTPPPKEFLNLLMQKKQIKSSDDAMKAFFEVEETWKIWMAKNPNVVTKSGKPDVVALCKLWKSSN
jgi:hypothetical protein